VQWQNLSALLARSRPPEGVYRGVSIREGRNGWVEETDLILGESGGGRGKRGLNTLRVCQDVSLDHTRALQVSRLETDEGQGREGSVGFVDLVKEVNMRGWQRTAV